MNRSQTALYRRAYPALLCQIDHLRAWLSHDDNIGLVVLFGSTARLTAHQNSDADLLILVRQPASFYQHPPHAGVALLVEAEQAAMEHGGWEWPFISLVEQQVSDLPPALLKNIARDGVLLYLRQDMPLPPPLAHLLPYETWRKRIETLLESNSPVAGHHPR
jgi:predicted nucleotidyltransferase